MSQSAATILLGYDFSDSAAEAAQVAFSIAQRTGADLRAVLVVERASAQAAGCGILFGGGATEHGNLDGSSGPGSSRRPRA